MKLRDIILIAVFLVAISLPFGVQLAGNAGGTQANEKRKLAALPALPKSFGELWKFPGKFTTYYGDNFGLRAKLIRLHALAMYRIFGMSPSDKVLSGCDGWLYYADDSSMEDYRSLTPFKVAEMEKWRQVLEARQDWLAKRGAKLVVVFACDKYVIYPEFLPAAYRRTDVPYRVDELTEYLAKNSKLTVVALKQPLVAAKSDRLYHRTDTHWNDRGAYIGYREILSAIGQQPLAYAPVEKQTEGWDLARMMGLNDIISEEDRQLQLREPRRAKIVEIDREDPTWNVGRVALEIADQRLPKLVMFRDSFGSALVPFLAEHFRRSLFLWQYDFDLAIIEKEKPDVVIWETTSRRFHSTWFEPVNPPLP
ncbi:MAG: hypothetical protein WCG79_09665 [Verrucomicrobiota bacterium]